MDVKKSIVQMTKEGEIIKIFRSAQAASSEIKIDSSGIAKVCKGKRKTCGGFMWRYATEEEKPEIKVPEGGKEHPYFSSYIIYPEGKVYSKVFNKFMKQQNECGYRCVTLMRDKKGSYKSIHVLVAETFISNPDGKKFVNHINGNKSDNRVENLEWSTRSENIQHAHDNGLIKKIVLPEKGRTNKDGELWKWFHDNKNYEISSYGRIYSHKCGRLLKPYHHNGGYTKIKIGSKGDSKNYSIHRLVAIAFIRPPPKFLKKPIVHHKDRNRSNNHVSNLQWISSSENAIEAYRAQSQSKRYRPVSQYTKRGEKIRTFECAQEAAMAVGVQYQTIYSACTGKSKTSCGYIWKYE